MLTFAYRIYTLKVCDSIPGAGVVDVSRAADAKRVVSQWDPGLQVSSLCDLTKPK